MIGVLIIWILFFASRLFLWKFPPLFTDVVHNYYDYARLWSEGYTPYLKHLFEYGPANIIIFYLPRMVDQLRVLDYRTTYRIIVLIFDIAVLSLIIKTLQRLKVGKAAFYLSLIYYLAATTKAKDFLYDSMDLIFISGLFIYLIMSKISSAHKINNFFSWFFFWLATAFKYITAPLVVPFLFINKGKKLKKELIICIMAFLAVWLVPLLIFRSSLSVTFIYHWKRGFQVESVPANIIRLVNSWTRTESYIEVFKNYDIVGPVTSRLAPFLSLLFPLAMGGFLLYSFKKAIFLAGKTKFDKYKEQLRLSLIYLFLFLLTSKVFSTPFHLWLPPLLAIYPFKSFKKQVIVLLTSFFMIAISMTPIPNLKFSIFDVHTAIGIARPICLLFMLFLLIKE